MTVAIGVDVGSGVIKTALFRVEGEKSAWLSRWDARIRQRNTLSLVEESMRSVLDSAGLSGRTSTTSRPPARGKACRARRGTSTR